MSTTAMSTTAMSTTVRDSLMVLFGLFLAGSGWAAWTGRWRSWVNDFSRHYRFFGALPGGLGLALAAMAKLLDEAAPGAANALMGTGAVLLLGASVLMFVSILGIWLPWLGFENCWYPRWYRELPEGERQPW